MNLIFQISVWYCKKTKRSDSHFMLTVKKRKENGSLISKKLFDLEIKQMNLDFNHLI